MWELERSWSQLTIGWRPPLLSVFLQFPTPLYILHLGRFNSSSPSELSLMLSVMIILCDYINVFGFAKIGLESNPLSWPSRSRSITSTRWNSSLINTIWSSWPTTTSPIASRTSSWTRTTSASSTVRMSGKWHEPIICHVIQGTGGFGLHARRVRFFILSL